MNRSWFRNPAWLLLFLVPLVYACGGRLSLEPVSLTDEDDGSRVELQVGQALTVNLPGEAAGVSWQVPEIDEAVLEYRGLSIRSTLGAGYVALNFTALAPGDTPVRVEWHRIGSGDVRTFSIQVTVR